MGFTSASWSADMTTSAVAGGATSAATNQPGTSEKGTPQLNCDWALATGATPMPHRRSHRAATITRTGPPAQRFRYLISMDPAALSLIVGFHHFRRRPNRAYGKAHHLRVGVAPSDGALLRQS